MKFNFIATTFRYHEESLIDELKDLFYEFEDLSVIFNKTNIDGLIIGSCLKDPIDFILFLRNKIKERSLGNQVSFKIYSNRKSCIN